MKTLYLIILVLGAKIDGPDTFKRDTLQGSYTVTDTEDNTGYLLDVDSELVDQEYKDNRLLFVGPPGEYKINAISIKTEAGKPPILSKFSRKVRIVEGDSPPNDPPNNDTPKPKPKYGLDTQSKMWLLTVPSDARSNAKEIAGVLLETANKADENKYDSISTMESALGASLSLVIDNKTSWQGFGASLQASISTLKATNEITNPKEFAIALREVASGMQQ